MHWSDPAAPDALALDARPAAALMALALLVSGLLAGRADGELARPLAPVALPLTALVVGAAVRWLRASSPVHTRVDDG